MEGNACIQCGQTGTNCKACANAAGVCDTCNDAFFLDTTTKKCTACATGCKTCTAAIATCTACIDGYFKDATTNTCTACAAGCATCTAANACTKCNDFYLLTTGVCAKSDCSKETVKKYILINDFTCTDCTIAGYTLYNATYCQNMPAPTVVATVQADGAVKADFTCAQGKNLYYVYGLAGSAYLSLDKLQALIKTPVYDPTTFRTVKTQSITAATLFSVAALPNIKNSGEKYTLVAFCEYLGANSTATTTFTSFNNTKLETLVIGLTTATPLTSAQKPTVAAAIATVLGTTRPVWTDEDKPYYALASARILQAGTSNFYILPDYNSTTLAADAVITAMKSTITTGATAFATAVGTKSAFTFTGATAVSYSSSVASPSLFAAYPLITTTDTTFSFPLKQSGAAGTLFWAYKKEAPKANNTQTTITEADFALLTTTSNSTAATVDIELTATVTGLTADTSYTVYYYGQNTGLPKMKTPIYSQIITTKTTAAPTGVEMLRYGFFVLLAMIMVILV